VTVQRESDACPPPFAYQIAQPESTIFRRLGHDLTQSIPDHSTLMVIRKRPPLELPEAGFTFALSIAEQENLPTRNFPFAECQAMIVPKQAARFKRKRPLSPRFAGARPLSRRAGADGRQSVYLALNSSAAFLQRATASGSSFPGKQRRFAELSTSAIFSLSSLAGATLFRSPLERPLWASDFSNVRRQAVHAGDVI